MGKYTQFTLGRLTSSPRPFSGPIPSKIQLTLTLPVTYGNLR